MNKYIISFAAMISEEGKFIGNCQVSYNYFYDHFSNKMLWSASYISAIVFLFDNDMKYASENWDENNIQNSSNNTQGKQLVMRILNEHLKETKNIFIDVQIERFLLDVATNPAKHVYVTKNYKEQRQIVQIPATPINNEDHVLFTDTLRDIGTKYLR